MLCLKYYRIFILVLASIFFASISSAQRNTTPGLPWTYVTPDSVPVGAFDTAFVNTFFNVDSLANNDIRWVYIINCHIELTNITDSNTFFIEVPRDPGAFGLTERTEMVEMRNAFSDTITGTSFFSAGISGQNSASHPEYFFPEVSFSQFIALDERGNSLDTIYEGRVVRAPNLNVILPNNSDSSFHTYAYFLQIVDSIFHPQISSILTPKNASSFNTFPNPTTSQFSIELPTDWETKKEGYMLRIYDPTAKLIEVQRIWYASSLENLALPKDGPPGLYTVTLYDERGELALGRVLKR